MPPAPTSSTPPSLLRRPGCWVTFLTLVPLLIGGLYLTENIVGARRLARVTADLAAAGIELDPHKIPPARPPDEENFFATPFLAAIGRGAAHSPWYGGGAAHSEMGKDRQRRKNEHRTDP